MKFSSRTLLLSTALVPVFALSAPAFGQVAEQPVTKAPVSTSPTAASTAAQDEDTNTNAPQDKTFSGVDENVNPSDLATALSGLKVAANVNFSFTIRGVGASVSSMAVFTILQA